MVSQIKKRDGRIEPFCKQKIIDAIRKANVEVAPHDQMADEFINDVVDQVCFECEFCETLDVENVQDVVETALMRNEAYAVAKNISCTEMQETRLAAEKRRIFTMKLSPQNPTM